MRTRKSISVRRLSLWLAFAFTAVIMALAGPAQEVAQAAPPGQYREAYNCSERWSPFRNVNSPYSDKRLYFKMSTNGPTFWLGRGGITCLVPITHLWVPGGCKVKHWAQAVWGWELKRTYTSRGWNGKSWAHINLRSTNEKYRIYC